ncbi:MAG TPA: THUMP domain-containing protein [Candidatus Thermoplasmatota archaeon]|nr:THUMP domain-containing protein [Candidatus Thermoplasmatota archaeon]
MAWPPILVRYGEIGIKTRSVRAQFERRLVDRIEEQLVARGVEAEVQRGFGRLYVRAADVDGALDALAHTFGIVSASPAIECAPTPEGVAEVALRVAREAMPAGASFALRVKRSGAHPFTSLDVAKHAAGRILDELADRKPTVDLDAPDFPIAAEVREGEGFVFTRTVRGPGGLPLGSQGRVGLLVEGPRAAHAAWLIGKRGASILFLSADPAQAEAWLAPLRRWMPRLRVHAIRAATRADALGEAASFLAQNRCQALVVADGAAEALARFEEDRAAGVPVFRPLVGFEGPRFAQLCRDAELPEVA